MLRKLDKQAARAILDYMDLRVANLDNPRSSGKALSGHLSGLWRYRIMDYRVICDIQDNALTVLVVTIGNRKNVYQLK